MDILNCRYIQGAPFFGSSIANFDSVIPNDSAEVAVVNDVGTSASNATTLRARLVGQGYKQVKSVVLAVHYVVQC